MANDATKQTLFEHSDIMMTNTIYPIEVIISKGP